MYDFLCQLTRTVCRSFYHHIALFSVIGSTTYSIVSSSFMIPVSHFGVLEFLKSRTSRTESFCHTELLYFISFWKFKSVRKSLRKIPLKGEQIFYIMKSIFHKLSTFQCAVSK